MNRRELREALATLLQSLVTSGLVEAVYSYRVGDFQGKSPVVVVSSAGTDWEPLTFEESRYRVYLDIFVFVAYSAPGWTEKDAEDRLDDIEHAIRDLVVSSHDNPPYWRDLRYVERTDARREVVVGGIGYRSELIPLELEVY